MADAYSLTCVVNDAIERIYITAVGPQNSAEFVDGQLALFESRPDIIGYDRLVDLSLCTGHVSYPDVLRLAAFWNAARFSIRRNIHLAVITRDSFVIARLPLSATSYPKHVMKPFDTIAEGDAWIDDMRRARG